MTIKTITAAELLEVLQDVIAEHGEDMQVIFTADYGDIGHTPQALPLKGEAELLSVKESGYSHSGFAIIEADEDDDEDEDEDEDEDDVHAYVVIR